jgi:hypothetical protein
VRRIKLILSAAAAMAVLMVLTAAPAVAQDLDDLDLEDVDGAFFGDGVLLVSDGDVDDFFDDLDGFAVGPAALEFEQEDVTSGDVAPVVEISNAGDNANLAPTVLQSANSGNVQNAQGAVLFGSEVDDVEFSGSSIEISPSVESDVTQTIQQSTGASW